MNAHVKPEGAAAPFYLPQGDEVQVFQAAAPARRAHISGRE